jgi:uncharacterized Zn-binding protein involved in type VI secretion
MKKLNKILVLSLFVIFSFCAQAYSYELAPEPVFQPIDENGDPYAGGVLYTYESGTTTPLATYDEDGNSNGTSVTLDSAGRADIWLAPNTLYRFKLTDSDGNVIYTRDNIKSIQDVLSSDTTFLVEHNADGTHLFKLGRFLSEFTDLADARDTIGATETTLTIEDDAVMDENVTLPATLTVKGNKGNSITTTGYTLTINGTCIGADGMFAGTGTVVLAGNTIATKNMFNGNMTVTCNGPIVAAEGMHSGTGTFIFNSTLIGVDDMFTGNATIAIDGDLIAGAVQLWPAAATVTFGGTPPPVFIAEWWGAIPGGDASANATALQAGIDASETVDGVFHIGVGTYAYDTTLTYTSRGTFEGENQDFNEGF